ncbi:hypothetical protein HDU97_000863 [Phlyctochytrium planicorne]|nr:hypothetical protein HDU97_000863 [Phlyctochytrium planicorne]
MATGNNRRMLPDIPSTIGNKPLRDSNDTICKEDGAGLMLSVARGHPSIYSTVVPSVLHPTSPSTSTFEHESEDIATSTTNKNNNHEWSFFEQKLAGEKRDSDVSTTFSTISSLSIATTASELPLTRPSAALSSTTPRTFGIGRTAMGPRPAPILRPPPPAQNRGPLVPDPAFTTRSPVTSPLKRSPNDHQLRSPESVRIDRDSKGFFKSPGGSGGSTPVMTQVHSLPRNPAFQSPPSPPTIPAYTGMRLEISPTTSIPQSQFGSISKSHHSLYTVAQSDVSQDHSFIGASTFRSNPSTPMSPVRTRPWMGWKAYSLRSGTTPSMYSMSPSISQSPVGSMERFVPKKSSSSALAPAFHPPPFHKQLRIYVYAFTFLVSSIAIILSLKALHDLIDGAPSRFTVTALMAFTVISAWTMLLCVVMLGIYMICGGRIWMRDEAPFLILLEHPQDKNLDRASSIPPLAFITIHVLTSAFWLSTLLDIGLNIGKGCTPPKGPPPGSATSEQDPLANPPVDAMCKMMVPALSMGSIAGFVVLALLGKVSYEVFSSRSVRVLLERGLRFK